MITYELAKKLKDAGYPIKEWSGSDGSGPDFEIDGVAYLEPNLSELIEACGDKFYKLIQDDRERFGYLGTGKWIACFYHRNPDTHTNTCFAGQTPEEAVANLWLELNKNG